MFLNVYKLDLKLFKELKVIKNLKKHIFITLTFFSIGRTEYRVGSV